MRAGRFLLLVPWVALAACQVPATQAVVWVDTDLLPEQGEIDQFGVKVMDPGGDEVSDRVFELTGPDAVTLPASFGVAPAGGDPDRRVTIEVRAMQRGTELFKTSAATRFVEHRAMRLDLFLARRCRTEALYCPEDQTCGPNGCVPIDESGVGSSPGGAPGPIADWAVSFPLGGEGPELVIPFVTTDDRGNVYLAGLVGRPVVFPDAAEVPTDDFYGFVVAMDAGGQYLWHTLLISDAANPNSNLMIGGVAADDEGVTVAGHYEGGLRIGEDWNDPGTPPAAFFASLDPATGGTDVVRTVPAGGGAIYLNDFERAANGFAIAGQFSGRVRLGEGHEYDVEATTPFVALLDRQFEASWSCALPPAANVLSVAVDEDGATLIGANATDDLWGVGFGSAIVASLGADGTRDCEQPVWTHQTVGAPFQVRDLALRRGMPAAVVGRAPGPISVDGAALAWRGGDDALLERLDARGAAQNGLLMGGTGNDEILTVAMDDIGRVAVAGLTTGPIATGTDAPPDIRGPTDAFVAAVGPDGVLLWAQTFGSDDVDTAFDVTLDRATGALLAAGLARGRVEGLGLSAGIFVRRFVP